MSLPPPPPSLPLFSSCIAHRLTGAAVKTTLTDRSFRDFACSVQPEPRETALTFRRSGWERHFLSACIEVPVRYPRRRGWSSALLSPYQHADVDACFWWGCGKLGSGDGCEQWQVQGRARARARGGVHPFVRKLSKQHRHRSSKGVSALCSYTQFRVDARCKTTAAERRCAASGIWQVVGMAGRSGA